MISKPLVAAFLAAGCVGAAAAGAYVAVRQNTDETARTTQTAATVTDAAGPKSVVETEAVVKPSPDTAPVAAPVEAGTAGAPQPKPEVARPSQPERTASQTRPERAEARRDPPSRTIPRPTTPPASQRSTPSPTAAPPPADTASVISQARTEPVQPVVPNVPEIPPAPPEPQFVQVVLPASTVIGLHVETSLSSEQARVEDRVEARVTRDVSAAGRVAIPAGSRVIGSVVLVERGGKLKERARLGVRFHTLVLADGTEQPIRTDPIYREGASPGGESARKIGGATVGGAILGAILGGGKGAAIGGAAGAAGGTAVVMAGDRNAANLPAGTVVTVRLAEPVSVEVEKRGSER